MRSEEKGHARDWRIASSLHRVESVEDSSGGGSMWGPFRVFRRRISGIKIIFFRVAQVAGHAASSGQWLPILAVRRLNLSGEGTPATQVYRRAESARTGHR